ncbi:MAG: leucine-rich repeat domain-containing protein [Clostridia bacterium]
MKKKSIILVLLVILSLTLALTGCYAKYGTVKEGIFEYDIQDGKAILKGYTDNTGVTKVVIPDEIDGAPVVKLDDYAVVNTLYVTEMFIGKNVEEITPFSINNNNGLKTFTVHPENKFFKAIDGTLYTIDGKELVSNPIQNGVTEHECFDDKGKPVLDVKGNKTYDKYRDLFVIPDGVETVRDNAFYHNIIKKVVMADSVKVVGECSFLRISYLSEVVFSKNLEVIGKDAFSKNGGLKEVTIYGNIKEIGTFAFFDCEKLKIVNIAASEENIKLGKKWYPTKLGKKIKDIVYNWNYQVK